MILRMRRWFRVADVPGLMKVFVMCIAAPLYPFLNENQWQNCIRLNGMQNKSTPCYDARDVAFYGITIKKSYCAGVSEIVFSLEMCSAKKWINQTRKSHVCPQVAREDMAGLWFAFYVLKSVIY